MTALQKAVLGTPPTGVDGDPVRTANTKFNSNVDVLNQQATLTSFTTTLTAAQALNAANHLGKRVNINLAAAGTINLPAASTCVADGVILLRNLGATLVTLAITTGSGDTIALTALAAGESALMDTDGAHAWNCLTRGRPGSLNETVLGNCAVSGNETVGGTLAVAGITQLTGALTANGVTATSLTVTGAISASGAYSGTSATYSSAVTASNFTSALGANSSTVAMYVTGASGGSALINTSKTGTGTALPLDIYTNSVFSFRFYVGGAGQTNAPGTFPTPIVGGALHLGGTPQYGLVMNSNGAASSKYWLMGPNTGNNYCVFNQGAVGVYVVDGTTAWGAQSDERLKNVRNVIGEGSLEAVKNIRTVIYSWKEHDDHAEALGLENNSSVHVGVIAQDVQKYLPEAVHDAPNGYLGVAYTDLIPLCMAAIKELSEKLDSAQAQITALQARAA